MFVDADDTIKATDGYAKQGAGFGYSGQKGLNALLATISTPTAAPVIAATRLRKGSTNSARGAARLVADALVAATAAWASRLRILRADSADYTHDVIAAARRGGARFSVTARATRTVTAAISSIAEDAWTPIHYPNAVFDQAEQRLISDAEVAEVGFTAFTGRRNADHVTARLIVRRVKRLNPHSRGDGEQSAEQGELFAAYRYHAVFTDSPLPMLEAETCHRAHAVIEQLIADTGLPVGAARPWHLAEGAAGQAQHRTRRPARRRHPHRPRRLDGHPRTSTRLPHPRHGSNVDFLFVIAGDRIGGTRIRRGIADAITLAGPTDPAGHPLRVTPHQFRHTYATSLLNAGMTLQGLMALLGHVSPQMTLRYASLADTTVRGAYDAAMAKMRQHRPLPLVVNNRPQIPDHVQWLSSEMLKTRVAHGYCSRHLAADACPYANICEQCDNFQTTPEFLPQLQAQLTDEEALHDDAVQRGWDSEVARHARVIANLQRHLDRLR